MAQNAVQDFGIKPHKGNKTDTPVIDVKQTSSEASTEVEQNVDDVPMSPRNFSNPFSRQHSKLHVDDYFVSCQWMMTFNDAFCNNYSQEGPMDTLKHSKWPVFLRIQGSVLPQMIIPLIFVAAWSTLITVLCRFVHNLSVSDVLLTVLGFVVGLALSFRTSASYERYSEGRKYWASLQLASHNLARTIWVQAGQREGDLGKHDLLAKLTGLNLIVAFAVALKHRLRYEPYAFYDDLDGLVGHLQTFAKAASTSEAKSQRKESTIKQVGELLGVSFAESNPRKALKKATQPLGNLPLEILSYLSSYLDEVCENGTMKHSMHQVFSCMPSHRVRLLLCPDESQTLLSAHSMKS